MQEHLLGLRVGEADEANDFTLGGKDLGNFDGAGDGPVAGGGAVEDDGILGWVDADVVARSHLLDSFPQEAEVGLDEEIEEYGLGRIKDDERGHADGLAVDEDLVGRDHKDVGDGRIGHRHARERFLEIEHLGLANRDVQPDQSGIGRKGGRLTGRQKQ